MFNFIENEMQFGCFAPCVGAPLLLKPLADKVKRAVAQKVLLSGRRLENQLFSSCPSHSGFNCNTMIVNDLKRHEVFKRKTPRRETQQTNLITKGRNQRQINE
jgi:hypothetical protein